MKTHALKFRANVFYYFSHTCACDDWVGFLSSCLVVVARAGISVD